MTRTNSKRSKRDVRRANGSARTKVRTRVRIQARPCWICEHSIDYSLPPLHNESFECDELMPVSFGGSAIDATNLAASHRCCNNWRSNRSVAYVQEIKAKVLVAFGQWNNAPEFVKFARAIERDPCVTKAKQPPRITTDW